MPDRPSPITTAADALQVAGAGLTLAERLAGLLSPDPARRLAAKVARLRGKAARLRGRAEATRAPRRAATLRARAAGADAEADALTGALATCAD